MDCAPTEWLGPLSALADEELVALAKSWEGQEAMDVLISRHRATLERMIAYLARGENLTREDCKDAQQQVFFGFCEAVRCFDPTGVRSPREPSFGAFLGHVVRMRFLDFVRCVRRDRKRCGRSLESLELLDSHAYQLPGLVGYGHASPHVGEDPARMAEAKEERQRLAAAVEKLDERQRQVWDAMANGATRRMIAKQFGVTYGVAMHWRQEVIGILKAAVKDPSENLSSKAKGPHGEA